MIRRQAEAPRLSGRMEWAQWKQSPKPEGFCDGMRYSNTHDLSDSGFTPTLLPLPDNFLADHRNKDSYLVTQLPAAAWSYHLLPFSLDVAVAITSLEQLNSLARRNVSLWDRHPGNILVSVEPKLQVWQVDLETVFDLESEQFRHLDKPQTQIERMQASEAKQRVRRGVHPINLQIQLILASLVRNYNDKITPDEDPNRHILNDLYIWYSQASDLRISKLSGILGNLRNLQQRL